jgi:hypothetical protein
MSCKSLAAARPTGSLKRVSLAGARFDFSFLIAIIVDHPSGARRQANTRS